MSRAEAAAITADATVPVAHRVLHRVEEADDTATLVLEPVDAPLAAPRPGQFHMMWAFGVGEVPISVSAIGPAGTLSHTVRAVGPVTAALVATPPGGVIGLRGPFGTGWPLEDAAGRHVVLVAGGLGIAPLRPALAHLLARRSSFGRAAVLVGARSPSGLLFTAELEAAREHDVQVEVTVDHAMRPWVGDVGVVTELVPRVDLDADAAAAMVCGPELMMRLTVRALLERGLAPERIAVALERNMQCAIGTCGHCQLGPLFVCRDGPVLTWPRVATSLGVRER